tara:strand:- start:649 stop:975 length:327 start_codon:yes stop_codon:yes gene_type:complete
MNYKNYIKNPVKISTLLPKVLKPLKKKNDGVLLEIKLYWEKILEPRLSSRCFASSLKKVNNTKILIITTDERNILELSYSSNEIKMQINEFFKSTVINEIKFKKSLQN